MSYDPHAVIVTEKPVAGGTVTVRTGAGDFVTTTCLGNGQVA